MAREKPAPISLKKPRQVPPATDRPVAAFNKDTPEHKEQRRLIVNKTVKDKALEQRVATLESDTGREIIVKVDLPVRPRIRSIAVQYDNFGAPKNLIPTYED